MSQWTHLNGQVRIDGFPGHTKKPNFGTVCDVPCGSEGSVRFRYDEVGTGIVWTNVSIWGDLRDYNDVQEIVNWISKCTEGYIIRSGILEIDIEYAKMFILRYNYKSKSWDIVYDAKNEYDL